MLDRNEMVLRDERYAPQAMAPYMPPPMVPYMPPPEPEEPSIVLSIFRHFWILLTVLGFCVLLACIFLHKTTPLYESHSVVWIQTNNAPMFMPGDGQSAAAATGGNFLQTQAAFMKSQLILSAVLQKPEIANLPTIKHAVPSAISYLLTNLQADVGRTNDLITVSITTPRPDDSAMIVTAVVQQYIDYQNNSKTDNYSIVLNELKPHQAELENSIRDNEEALENLRQKNPSISLAANGQVTSPAQAAVAAAAQNYENVRLQRVDAEINYGSANPQLIKMKAREIQAWKEYQEALNRATETNTIQDQYTKYAADLAQEQLDLKPVNDRITSLEMQQDVYKNIHSITPTEWAVPAKMPSFPQPAQVLGLAGVIGIIVGSFLAYLRDRTDNRLRTAEEIQNLVGLQILGVVPRMPGRRTSVARAMAVHLDPRSEVAEAYRTIRTAVYFGVAGTRARTLLVTSPEAGDGKTTSASNLAIAIAQTGRSVLLLDADFRKPTQHKNLDVKDSVGLSSVLSGTETLDRAIQRTGVDGLDILPCGTIPGNPSEILNSQEFGELVDRLALKYDHIIFDSPPVNLVTDARILGAVCDATVLVLRAEKSTRKAAEHARNALLSVGAKVIGAVVNDAARGKGYETYGGSYYGTAAMRGRGESYPTPPTTSMYPTNGGFLPRVPRPDADIAEG
jgi:capsular exopolysaccharide synthesis family protein